MGLAKPDVAPTSENLTDTFAAWQLADELAGYAERLVCDAFNASTHGNGVRPSVVQLEIARTLRTAASDTLRIALVAFEGPRRDPLSNEGAR